MAQNDTAIQKARRPPTPGHDLAIDICTTGQPARQINMTIEEAHSVSSLLLNLAREAEERRGANGEPIGR